MEVASEIVSASSLVFSVLVLVRGVQAQLWAGLSPQVCLHPDVVSTSPSPFWIGMGWWVPVAAKVSPKPSPRSAGIKQGFVRGRSEGACDL